MKKLTYYVATSLDGFIATLDDDISGFTNDEQFISHYYAQLNQFKAVIMGKNTYEFGYKYGLKPGAKAYAHMEHYIFSKTIEVPEKSEVNVVTEDWVQTVQELKRTSSTDIYLCGGSQFAGYLAKEKLIDQVWVKLNPFCMGTGKPLFAGPLDVNLRLEQHEKFECGVVELRYQVIF